MLKACKNLSFYNKLFLMNECITRVKYMNDVFKKIREKLKNSMDEENILNVNNVLEFSIAYGIEVSVMYFVIKFISVRFYV